MKTQIVKSEITHDAVRIHLANGVSIDIVSSPGHLHCHFSGIKEGIIATPFAQGPDNLGKLKLANYVDLKYTPSKED